MPILPKNRNVLPMYYPSHSYKTPMIHYQTITRAPFMSQADHRKGWRVKNAPALGVAYSLLGRKFRARKMPVLQVFSCALGVLIGHKTWVNRMSRDGPGHFCGRSLYDTCMTPSKCMTHMYYYTNLNLKSQNEQYN